MSRRMLGLLWCRLFAGQKG